MDQARDYDRYRETAEMIERVYTSNETFDVPQKERRARTARFIDDLLENLMVSFPEVPSSDDLGPHIDSKPFEPIRGEAALRALAPSSVVALIVLRSLLKNIDFDKSQVKNLERFARKYKKAFLGI